MTTAIQTPVPILPCPECGENILKKGFYNSCSETTTLREDNTATMMNGRVCLDHDEDNYDTVSHECDVEAYCSNCKQLLPWPLYDIRELDYKTLAEAEKIIAELVMSASEEEADSEVPQSTESN